MGAAGSVQSVYRSGAVWFKEYFDTEKYILDFYEICGRDSEGVIHLYDFKRWITNQAENVGGYWRVLLSTNEVISLAFEYSCVHLSRSTVMGKKVVDITHFRTLLVQLFVVSVLWSLFRKADSNCLDAENPDAFNNELNFDEFAFAMRTFCVCYAQKQELTDADILADFQLLDPKKTGHVQFVTVCQMCSKFMHTDFCQQFAAAKTREQRVILLSDSNNNSTIANTNTFSTSSSTLGFKSMPANTSPPRKTLALQQPERSVLQYSMQEAPIDLIIDLQSHPSDEEREYLPSLAFSRNHYFDENNSEPGLSVSRHNNSNNAEEKHSSRHTYGSSPATTKASPSHHSNSNNSNNRQNRMGMAMACLSAKIEEDLEKADLVSMRMSTWQNILQSPSSNKLFSSVLSPKSGRTFSPL